MKMTPVSPFANRSLRLLIVVGASLGSALITAQTTQTKQPATETPSFPGFSIETEMLTYRALESNSEAIACDVAAYLYGTRANFKNPPADSVCTVTAVGQSTNTGVIIMPFDRSVFSDFELWRADMQAMAELESRSSCVVTNSVAATSQPNASRGGTEGPLLAVTPIGAAISTAEGVLSLFSSARSDSPVIGTIQDQALMDGVSRELRAVNVAVLMPAIYPPYALTSIDPTRSPFLIALNKLRSTRDCLVTAKATDNPVVKDINDFLDTLSAPIPSSKPATSQTPPSSSSATTAKSPSNESQSSAPTVSHLGAVLSADGLAQRLGADPGTGKIPDAAPQHLLLLKALESGGSVSRFSNIFGTKFSYSGGSVDSYTLFDLDGQLVCSGNVYEYAGPVSSKEFEKQLHSYVPDPSKQIIFLHGGCSKK
jgi:hypothetical protein